MTWSFYRMLNVPMDSLLVYRITAVPNLFGSADWQRQQQREGGDGFMHTTESHVCSKWRFTSLPAACVACFPIGHGLVTVWGSGVGDPCRTASCKQASPLSKVNSHAAHKHFNPLSLLHANSQNPLCDKLMDLPSYSDYLEHKRKSDKCEGSKISYSCF